MLDFFAETWNDFVDFTYSLLLTLFSILKDFFYWILEQIFGLVLYLLDGLGYLFAGLDIAQYISMIPPQTAHIMSQIGFSAAMTMIISSLTIRFFLQLIPFVRFGS
jgi:hypothetical protein